MHGVGDAPAGILDEPHVKTREDGVKHRSAHATVGPHARGDEVFDPRVPELFGQARIAEGTGPTLSHDPFALQRRDLGTDLGRRAARDRGPQIVGQAVFEQRVAMALVGLDPGLHMDNRNADATRGPHERRDLAEDVVVGLDRVGTVVAVLVLEVDREQGGAARRHGTIGHRSLYPRS